MGIFFFDARSQRTDPPQKCMQNIGGFVGRKTSSFTRPKQTTCQVELKPKKSNPVVTSDQTRIE